MACCWSHLLERPVSSLAHHGRSSSDRSDRRGRADRVLAPPAHLHGAHLRPEPHCLPAPPRHRQGTEGLNPNASRGGTPWAVGPKRAKEACEPVGSTTCPWGMYEPSNGATPHPANTCGVCPCSCLATLVNQRVLRKSICSKTDSRTVQRRACAFFFRALSWCDRVPRV